MYVEINIIYEWAGLTISRPAPLSQVVVVVVASNFFSAFESFEHSTAKEQQQ